MSYTALTLTDSTSSHWWDNPCVLQPFPVCIVLCLSVYMCAMCMCVYALVYFSQCACACVSLRREREGEREREKKEKTVQQLNKQPSSRPTQFDIYKKTNLKERK